MDTSVVTLRLGNTDVAPYGMGSRGARGATAGGGTLFLCARDAQAKVLAIAARMPGLPGPSGLRMRDGRVQRSIDGGEWEATSLTLAHIARTAYLDPLSLPSGVTPGLDFSRTWDPPPMTYSNATHLCEVEVDIATGRVHIVRYLVAEDCGTVLNPVVVEGQQHGAVAMGLGGALYEQVYYDADGQNLSATSPTTSFPPPANCRATRSCPCTLRAAAPRRDEGHGRGRSDGRDRGGGQCRRRRDRAVRSGRREPPAVPGIAAGAVAGARAARRTLSRTPDAEPHGGR